MQNPEQLRGGGESTVEAQNAAAERSKELLKNAELSVERSPEQRAETAERARAEANEALLRKERGGAEKRSGGEPTAAGVRRVTKKEKKEAYQQTMRVIQGQMGAPSRTFSKVIHNPVVEKTSDAIGKTVARPNAIFAGSLTALIAVVTINLIARTFGYTLSGSEAIITFILGWVLGLIYDYFRVMATGKR